MMVMVERRERSMSRVLTGIASILAALSLAWLVTGTATLAQNATPTGSAPACVGVATPEVDAAMQDAYGSGTVPGTPVAGTPVATDELPQGQPANAETVAAADQVVQTWFACYLGGSELAVLALQSDTLDQELFGQIGQRPNVLRVTLDEDAVSTPIPLDPQVTISSGQDIRVLDDGRIGGIWSLNGDAAFVILVQEDGNWVVDDVIDIID
jgi:hypothetical protein